MGGHDIPEPQQGDERSGVDSWKTWLNRLLRPEPREPGAEGTPEEEPELLSPPIPPGQLQSLKAEYLHRLRARFGALRLYGLDARRR